MAFIPNSRLALQSAMTVSKLYSTTAVSAKPQLRGLLSKQIGKNLVVMSVLNLIAVIGAGIYFNGRKERYGNFYKNYNAEESYNRMKGLGLFQSSPK